MPPITAVPDNGHFNIVGGIGPHHELTEGGRSGT